MFQKKKRIGHDACMVGYFDTELHQIKIPCLAPLCPKPPEAPFEGKRENFPSVHPMIEEEVCDIDWQQLSLQCSSFEIIHITKATYGRAKFTKDLCNGEKDSKHVEEDCVADLTDLYGGYCAGKYNCSFHILPTVHDWTGGCLAGQKNELTVSYICGKKDV